MTVVPSVSEEHRHRVFARSEQSGHIVFDIRIAFFILRNDRREHAVVGLPPVDIEFMPSESAEKHRCFFRGFVTDKCFTQIRRRADPVRRCAHRLSVVNPVSVPFASHDKLLF